MLEEYESHLFRPLRQPNSDNIISAELKLQQCVGVVLGMCLKCNKFVEFSNGFEAVELVNLLNLTLKSEAVHFMFFSV